MSYHVCMMIVYDESYIQNAQDRDFGIYEKKFENLTSEIVFTHMHFHRDFEILYIYEGCAKMEIAGKTFVANSGDLVLVNPYEPHYGEIISPRFHYFCIDFNLALLGLPNEKRIMEGQLGYANHIQGESEITQYLLGCYDAVCGCKENWKMRAIGNLLLFFSYAGAYLHEAVHSKEHLFAKTILELLQEKYEERINTKMMADAFSYNESYFCRKFQKVFHCSFSDYLKSYRVTQAKKLLLYKSVAETAMETGFSSIPYFSRIFKEVTGMCPSEYRRKHNA